MSFLGCEHNSVFLAANMMSQVSSHSAVNMIAYYVQLSRSSDLSMLFKRWRQTFFFSPFLSIGLHFCTWENVKLTICIHWVHSFIWLKSKCIKFLEIFLEFHDAPSQRLGAWDCAQFFFIFYFLAAAQNGLSKPLILVRLFPLWDLWFSSLIRVIWDSSHLLRLKRRVYFILLRSGRKGGTVMPFVSSPHPLPAWSSFLPLFVFTNEIC